MFTLLPQEIPFDHPESDRKFSGPLYPTAQAVETHGMDILPMYYTLRALAVKHDGIDRLQAFDSSNGKLWFIDDVSHVTALLPSEY
jgi:hypothetical protein